MAGGVARWPILSPGTRGVGRVEPQPGGPIGPPDCPKIVPFAPDASSDRMRWMGLEAVRWCAGPAADLNPAAISHHSLLLFARPPEELHMKYEGLKRHTPPPAGSIM